MNNIRLLRFYLATGCTFTVLLLVLYYTVIAYKHIQWTNKKKAYTSWNNEYHERFRSQPVQKRDQQILIYQPEEMTPSIRNGLDPFRGCSIYNCFLSSKEYHKEVADVILFGENTAWEPPLKRPHDQIWIMQLLESPMNTLFLKPFNNMVNYTASYRTDADILSPYGVFKTNFQSKQQHLPYQNVAAGKTGGVAWFVSHCLTNNDRMGYVRKLQKYIKVDVFGRCGKYSISKAEGNRLLRNYYKFYLAFENSNCKQYITEKFWEVALQNDVIPIVMGAPRSDYELIAPSRSFIHVDDFESPRKLAEFIQRVNSDDDMYKSFFEWKKTGIVVDSGFHCRLCEFVQNPLPKVYANLDDWWRGKGECNNVNISTLTKQ